MKISVITPTHGREARLRAMVRCFQQQTWEDRELLILDDGPVPSRELAKHPDPRIRYRHFAQPLVLGEKRNRLCAEASGELIAHFDDDDLYAPNYLERMVAMRGEADFLTLSAWFAFAEKARTFWYWDTAEVLHFRYAVTSALAIPQRRAPTKDPASPGVGLNLWGYGFSYLYTRAAWDKTRFPAIGFGEDHGFAQRLQGMGLRRAFAPDVEGLALHVMHGRNSSGIFPQYALPEFLVKRTFGPWLAPLLPPPPD